MTEKLAATTAITTKGAFDALLDEIETMAKALPADGDGKVAGDDKAIAAAAADADNDGKVDVDKKDGDDEDAGDGESMTKSFTLKLDDGTEIEAVDGASLFKGVMERVETTETTIAKALTSAVGLIRQQGDMLKSLQSEVAKLANSGKGRKAVLTVAEKPAVATMAKSEAPDGIEPEEFMAKALTAQVAGKITGSEVARCESYLNRGMQPPADIVQRVLG